MCVCVCVRACVHACMRVCVRACVCVHVLGKRGLDKIFKINKSVAEINKGVYRVKIEKSAQKLRTR